MNWVENELSRKWTELKLNWVKAEMRDGTQPDLSLKLRLPCDWTEIWPSKYRNSKKSHKKIQEKAFCNTSHHGSKIWFSASMILTVEFLVHLHLPATISWLSNPFFPKNVETSKCQLMLRHECQIPLPFYFNLKLLLLLCIPQKITLVTLNMTQ